MNWPLLSLARSGIVCSVGLDSASTCAAVRSGTAGFDELDVCDRGGEWIRGARVPLSTGSHGSARQLQLLRHAALQCKSGIDSEQGPIGFLICVAASGERVEELAIESPVLQMIEKDLGVRVAREASGVIRRGRTGIVSALQTARAHIASRKVRQVLIAAVDSLLGKGTLTKLERSNRLLTSLCTNGFIPGEAASAVLVAGPEAVGNGPVVVRGLGIAREDAHIESGKPLRAEGICAATREALDEAGYSLATIDLRIADLSGEHYYFKEASLAVSRLLRERRDSFPIWHPADCLGEVGAAIGPLALAIAMAAVQKQYAPGDRILCHFGNDAGERGAVVLTAARGGRP